MKKPKLNKFKLNFLKQSSVLLSMMIFSNHAAADFNKKLEQAMNSALLSTSIDELDTLKIQTEIEILKLVRLDLEAIEFIRNTETSIDDYATGLVSLSTASATAVTSLYFATKSLAALSGAPQTIVFKETKGYERMSNPAYADRLAKAKQNYLVDAKKKDRYTYISLSQIENDEAIMSKIIGNIKEPEFMWVRERRFVEFIPGGKSANQIISYMSGSRGWISGTLRGSSLGVVAPAIIGVNSIKGLARSFPALLALTSTATIAGASSSNLFLLFKGEDDFNSFKETVDITIADLESLLP